jgi:hypothetical protein
VNPPNFGLKEPFTYRTFQDADLDQMDLMEEREIVLKTRHQLTEINEKRGDRSWCGTSFWKGRIFAVGGFERFEPNMSSIFIVPDRFAFEHPVLFLRVMRKVREWQEAQPWCDQIVTTSFPGERWDRFMQGLGFLYGKPLPSYNGTGRDYKLWSRRKIQGIWCNT